jgi:Tfp pilus assembly protein FimT
MAEEKKPLPIAEIVTGIIIVIILVVFAVPRYMNWTEGSIIEEEATKLYYNLETAKNTAIKNKHKVWVVFQGKTGYMTFEDVNGNGSLDSGEPARKIKLNPKIKFGINREPPLQNVWGTDTVSNPIDFGRNREKFYFKPSGKANRSGAAYLIAQKDLGSGTADIRAIKVIGAIGEISVVKFSPNDSPPWE